MGWRTCFPVFDIISQYFGCSSLRGQCYGLVLLCEVTFSLVFTEFYIEIHLWRFVILPMFVKYS